jgi:hypothetical protein
MEEVTKRMLRDDKYDSPYDINNGGCEEWATDVMEVFEKSDVPVEIWATPFGFADTNHCFVRVHGKFYDSECPEGCDDHMDLPIFKNLAKAGCRRQPVWCEDKNRAASRYASESRRDMTDEMLIEYDRQNHTNNSGKFPQHDKPIIVDSEE